MNVEKLGSEILRLVADALDNEAPKSGSAQLWEQMKAQARERATSYERPKFEDTNEIDDLRENHRIERNDLRAEIAKLRIERDRERLAREKAISQFEHQRRARDALAVELKQLRTENATHFLQRNELLNKARIALSVVNDLHPDLNLDGLAETVERIEQA